MLLEQVIRILRYAGCCIALVAACDVDSHGDPSFSEARNHGAAAHTTPDFDHAGSRGIRATTVSAS
jgi:hypothetical protein